jgi:uncharacterized protein YggE
MIMRNFVTAAIAIVWLTVPLAAYAAESSQDAPGATLTVTGEGQVTRAPDLATVAASIVTNDDNAARALSENNRRYAVLLAKLGALGIAGSDVASTSITSSFNPRPSGQTSNDQGQVYGFSVTRNAEIRVVALAQTGAIVDAATAAGATQINGVSYGFHDRRAIERAALAAAVSDAYAQAQTIAAAAHVRIVRILRIGNEGSPGRIGPLPMAMARVVEAPVPTTISPSDLEVAETVSVTYAIR